MGSKFHDRKLKIMEWKHQYFPMIKKLSIYLNQELDMYLLVGFRIILDFKVWYLAS